jgi:hypothetical protein
VRQATIKKGKCKTQQSAGDGAHEKCMLAAVNDCVYFAICWGICGALTHGGRHKKIALVVWQFLIAPLFG